MNGIKGLAMVLIAAGVIALAYGGFTYTRRSHEAQIGPLNVSVNDQHTVTVPVWAGIAAIVIGAGILLVPAKAA